MMLHGAKALSDSELLAIFIGGGTRGLSAIDLAKILLDKFENITELAKCDISMLKQVKGIGDAKAVTIAAAFELSKRIKVSPFHKRKIIRSPEEIADYYIPKFLDVQKELFYILLLNSANQIFREHVVSEGLLNSSLVHPREVFKKAISESANSIILMHNHPSGNPNPSQSDLQITKQLKEAGKIIGINVLDHLIIAGDKYYSFMQNDMM
jgi:DNA repair protein RadC